MIVLLVAGIGFLLAGLLAIGFGIPINEFGFGNTLIVAGTVTACTGMLLLGLWIAVRELRNIARRLGPGVATESRAETCDRRRPSPRRAVRPRTRAAFCSAATSPDRNMLEMRNRWHGATRRRRHGVRKPRRAIARRMTAACAGSRRAAPAVKPRRNLLFSSSSRKERERAQARTTDSAAADPHPEPAADAAGCRTGRAAARVIRRRLAETGAFADRRRRAAAPRAPDAAERRAKAVRPHPATERYPPAVRTEDPTQVTVLKSGVVDGMAYSLYSDGSIEAQMPEGMMRFASIDELRAHLDQRP